MHNSNLSKPAATRAPSKTQHNNEEGIASMEVELGKMIDDSMKDIERAENRHTEGIATTNLNRYPRLRKVKKKFGPGYPAISPRPENYLTSRWTEPHHQRKQQSTLHIPTPIRCHVLPVPESDWLWGSQSVRRIPTVEEDHEPDAKTDAATVGTNTESPSFSLGSYHTWHPGANMDATGNAVSPVDKADSELGDRQDGQDALGGYQSTTWKTHPLY